MEETGYYRDLVCIRCGKVFPIYSKMQCRKKYCSDKCKKEAERENERRRKEERASLKGEKKKYEKKKNNSYVDPETGAIYYKERRDDKLIVIDKACKKAGMSYGAYTSREYVPKIYKAYPTDKEKEYSPIKFVWKEQKKKDKKKEINKKEDKK